MSDQNTQSNTSEEVDLGQLFNAIGKIFERFFKFIASIFIAIFSVIIFALQAIIQYFKIIAIVLLVAFIIGFVYEKIKEPVYIGSMLVEPYFESQYQLASNINYYNSLINTDNHEALASVFNISAENARNLIHFNLEAALKLKTSF